MEKNNLLDGKRILVFVNSYSLFVCIELIPNNLESQVCYSSINE